MKHYSHILFIACLIAMLTGCKDDSNSTDQTVPSSVHIGLQFIGDSNSLVIYSDISDNGKKFALDQLPDFVDRRTEQEANKNRSINWTVHTSGYIDMNCAIDLVQPFIAVNAKSITIHTIHFVEYDRAKYIDFSVLDYEVTLAVDMPDGPPDSLKQCLLDDKPELRSNRYWFRINLYELRDVLAGALNIPSHVTIQTSQNINANQFGLRLDALKHAEVSHVNFMAYMYE